MSLTLITDRTAADLAAAREIIAKVQRGETLTEAEQSQFDAGMKGCYNASDMNRVEAAVKSIAAALNAAGYAVEVGNTHTILPAGYQRLEYIESTGSQYIDTGIVPDNNTSVTLDIDIVNADNWGPIFGSRDANVTNEFCMFAHNPTSVYQDGYGNAAHVNISASSVLGRQTIEKTLNETYINDELKNSFSAATFQGKYPMWLCQINSGGAATSYKISERIYTAYISQSAGLVRCYIPCKNPDGEVGLYDTITRSFYGNAGTGAFTAGTETESHDWQTTDIIRLSQWRQYLANVQALRDAYTALSTTPELPQPTDKLGIEGANNIERVLADIDMLISCMIASYRRCGAFNAGDNAAHLPLKGSAT